MSGWMHAGTILLASFMTAELPPSREAVLTLPPDLVEKLDAQPIRRMGDARARLEKLSHFIFSEEGLALRYDNSDTLTLAESYTSGQANCLTATLMFLVMAEQMGLRARAQEIDNVLVWNREDNTLYQTAHVNVSVQVYGERYIVDFQPDLLGAGHHRERRISMERSLAHFYNNRAAERMEQGDYLGAMLSAHMALRMDAEFASAWNNLGVLERRLGRLDAAERAYKQALALDARNGSALSNLVSLYRLRDDADSLAEYQARLSSYQRRDPFHQFMAGLEYEEQGKMREAYRHFRRAVRLHDGEHEFFFALARTYYEQGADRQAARSLQQAMDLSHGQERSLYQAKLDTLYQ